MAENLISNIAKGIYKKLLHGHPPYRKAGLSWLNMRMLRNMPEGRLNKVKLLGKEIAVFGRIGFLDALREIFFEEIYRIDLPASPYIIDCGANIGLSVIYFKQQYPKAEIVAFEPDAMNFGLLENNVKAFNLQNLTLRNEAVWVEDKELVFSNEGTMSSRIVTEGAHKVRGIRLKNCLNRKVDLLKIDIEGAEYAVLKDIADELQLVQHLFIEYHGKYAQNAELIEMLQIINSGGFSFYIKEATDVYRHPFLPPSAQPARDYDLQLNIFCRRI
jgi:FkbM family methyltransferase